MTQPLTPYDAMQNQIGAGQRVADAMRMSALTPIQSVSPYPGSNLSLTQVLAKLLEAHAGNTAQNQVLQRQEQLAQRMQGDLESGLDTLETGLRGADPRRAVIEAMAHPHPGVRSVATERYKGFLTPKDLAKKAVPASVLANPDNPAAFQPKVDLKSVAPGHALMDQAGNIVNPNVQPGAAPELIERNGDLFQKTATGLDLITKAPRISNSTTVNLPSAEKEFDKTFGRKEAMRLSEHLEKRDPSLEGLDAVRNSLKLLDEGIHTGIFAPLAKGVDKASIGLFKTDPAKASRTEQFIVNTGNIVIPRLKDFGGSDTVEEMKYLQKVSAGEITAEPETLRKVLTNIDHAIRRKISSGDKAVEAYKQRGGTLPTLDSGVFNEVPPPYKADSASKSQEPISPEEWLKMHGVK